MNPNMIRQLLVFGTVLFCSSATIYARHSTEHSTKIESTNTSNSQMFVNSLTVAADVVDRTKLQNQKITQRLFQRMVGTSLSMDSPLFEQLVSLVANGETQKALTIMQSLEEFYAVRVRNFAAPFSNLARLPTEPLNDAQALIIGIVRDDLDARLLLTGDFAFRGDFADIPSVSRANNDHYRYFESVNGSYLRNLRLVKPQWPDQDVFAGILTTRSYAKATLTDANLLNGGTNRRAVEYALESFLCTPKEKWRGPGIPDFFVRRDVNRKVNNDPQEYLHNCRYCHAGMDALAGAFARFDFVDEKYVYLKNQVALKFNRGADVYPEGYETNDDQWVNYFPMNHNANLGWRGTMQGRGVQSFGEMLANSKAFSSCMVQKVFQELCRRSPQSEEMRMVQELAANFELNGYKFRKLFRDVLLAPGCFVLR